MRHMWGHCPVRGSTTGRPRGCYSAHGPVVLAMGQADTQVNGLCKELAITWATPYVLPGGLRPQGHRALKVSK